MRMIEENLSEVCAIWHKRFILQPPQFFPQASKLLTCSCCIFHKGLFHCDFSILNPLSVFMSYLPTVNSPCTLAYTLMHKAYVFFPEAIGICFVPNTANESILQDTAHQSFHEQEVYLWESDVWQFNSICLTVQHDGLSQVCTIEMTFSHSSGCTSMSLSIWNMRTMIDWWMTEV